MNSQLTEEAAHRQSVLDSGRLRPHQGGEGGAAHAGRQDRRDLRGHFGGPAAGHRRKSVELIKLDWKIIFDGRRKGRVFLPVKARCSCSRSLVVEAPFQKKGKGLGSADGTITAKAAILFRGVITITDFLRINLKNGRRQQYRFLKKTNIYIWLEAGQFFETPPVRSLLTACART